MNFKLPQISTKLEEILKRDLLTSEQHGTYPSESIRALAIGNYFKLLDPNEGLFSGWRDFILNTINLSSFNPSVGVLYVMHMVSTWSISLNGDSTKNLLIRDLLSGRKMACLAISDESSDPTRLDIDKTSTNRKFVLRGTKRFCSGVHYSDVLVVAYSNEGRPFRHCIAYTSDSKVIPSSSLWEGMGLRGQDSCSVTFDSVCVAEDDLLQYGSPTARESHPLRHYPYSPHSLGFAAIAAGISYGLIREIFLQSKQRGYGYITQKSFYLGKLTVMMDSVLSLILNAISALENNEPSDRILCEEAKVYATKTALDISDMCLQLLGSSYYAKSDLRIKTLFNDLRGLQFLGPNHDVMTSIIGKDFADILQ